jgi:cysteine-rich repeat protein
MNKQFLSKTLPVFIALSMVLSSVGLLVSKTEATKPPVTTPNCNWNCPSNVVTVNKAWLADENMQEIGSCSSGENVSAYIWANIYNNTNTNRGAIKIFYDLYIDGNNMGSTQICLDEELSQKTAKDYIINSVPIIWPCGNSIELKNFNISFGSPGELCDDTKCDQRKSQCASYSTLTVNPIPSCGNGSPDTGEECDSGVNNGVVCNAPYGESCTYCSDTCSEITLNGSSCGDGTINNPPEICEINDTQSCTIDGYNGVQNCVACTGWSDCVSQESCGDGIANDSEQCDNGQSNDIPCTPAYGQQCTYCSDVCTNVVLTGLYCGDGVKNGDEECDGTDGVGAHQSCSETCTLVNLTYCGDQTINGDEVCELGDTNPCQTAGGYSGSQACTSDCLGWGECQTSENCGDGVINDGEVCDDGTQNGYVCTPSYGNTCDYCSDSCQTITLTGLYCGDGTINGDEVCELGDTNPCQTAGGYSGSQACTSDCLGWGQCQTTESCGDGEVNDGEECDAGIYNGNACTPDYNNSCTYCSDTCSEITLNGSSCGDGTINNPPEICEINDTQNCQTTSGYDGVKNCVACTGWSDCVSQESCGDGIANDSEQCDDGQSNNIPCTPAYDQQCTYCSDVCTNVVLTGPYCGDDIINGGEQCDDGNTQNGYACTPLYGGTCHYCSDSCQTITLTGPYCGDQTINGDEVCELGDTNPCQTAGGYSGSQACTSDCLGWGECQTSENCGDGVINDGEVCDDGTQNGYVCTPSYGNTCDYCSDSCQTITLTGLYCGDGICNENEMCLTCSTDCGTCPPNTGSLKICKYEDNEPFREYNVGDTSLAWDIRVDYPDQTSHDFTTDSVTGCVTIPDLPYDGQYTISEYQVTGWDQTYPLDPNTHTVTIDGEITTVYFLNYHTTSQLPTMYSCNPTTLQCAIDASGPFGSLQGCKDACGATAGAGGQYVIPAGVVAGAATEQGQVAGASTACNPYLLKFIKLGADNDPVEVKKLQSFLNGYLGLNLPVNGIYDQATYEAVKQFQLLLKNEVLAPWVIINCLPSENIATGYVYRTTTRAINNIFCSTPIPDVSDERCVGGIIIGFDGEGAVLGEATTTPTTTTVTTPLETTEETGTTGAQENGVVKSPQNWLWVLMGSILIGGAVYLVYRRKK